MQAIWALPLLILPVSFVYSTLKSAKDMRESTQHMMASVVDMSPDAILLLNAGGHIRLANQQAAQLHRCASVDALSGILILILSRTPTAKDSPAISTWR
jgi:PAS domain-containing protein